MAHKIHVDVILTIMLFLSFQQAAFCQPDFDKTDGVGLQPCVRGCGKDDLECECYLTIEHRLTMMLGDILVYPSRGSLYMYNGSRVQGKDMDKIITADGHNSRLVIAVNRQFPGPVITAYEGQRLIVHVRNLMHTDSFTLHWHGMAQKGSPYSDGVAFVTQCPVLPGHTFTHDFTANPHGTSFYHAHSNT